MKIKKLKILTIMLAVLFMFFGCTEEQENMKQELNQASKDMKDAQAQYENEWQQFKDNSELAIKQNEDRIIELKNEMEKTSSEFKAKYENKILAIEQDNIELKKKLNEFKYDGKETWQQFKQEFNDNIDSLSTSLNEIFEDK